MAYLAPAGTPIGLLDLLNSFQGTIHPQAADASLATELRQVSGLPYAWPLSSARAAMTVSLLAMRKACANSNRIEVIIPAYTCYSVPAAVVRAGLRPRLCDVDPLNLGMDTAALAQMDFSRTLAVVSANLYGLPNDLADIESICRRHGIYMLDDAAQALGATFDSRPVGSFGDTGLYSFDKGKIISTMQGGAIIAGPSPIADLLRAELQELPRCPWPEAASNLMKLVTYAVLLRPSLYGLARRIPFTGIGQTRYDLNYPITQLSGYRAWLATLMLSRLQKLNESRFQRAMELTAAIQGFPMVKPVLPLARANPVYARFPMRVTDPHLRANLVEELERQGIGATISYPRALADVDQVAALLPPSDLSVPGAREVAKTIVTLPTHAYCTPELAQRVRKALLTCSD